MTNILSEVTLDQLTWDETHLCYSLLDKKKFENFPDIFNRNLPIPDVACVTYAELLIYRIAPMSQWYYG